MKVVLIRHLKVIARARFFLTGHQFDEWRRSYDNAEIVTSEFKIKAADFPQCFVSPMKRAVETAKLIYDGKFKIAEELEEVKNASFLMRIVSLPSFFHSVAGRIAWYFNYKGMPETRNESESRARKFISRLLAGETKDTLVITHGFFMHCLKAELKANGFKGHLPVFPKNGHPYVFEK
jgi:broad specificity phosphatase PhoE